MIPLAALGFSTRRDLRGLNQERDAVQQMLPIAESRFDALRIAAALSDERTWSIAQIGVEQYGVDPDVVADFIGVDITAEFFRSQRETDELLEDYPLLAEKVAILRRDRVGSSSQEVAPAINALMAEVAATGDAAAERLRSLALAHPEGWQLIRALELTEAAAASQLAVSNQYVSWMSSQFVEGTGEPQEDLQNLVEAHREYEDQVAEIERLVDRGPLLAMFGRVITSESAMTMQASIDEHIATALSNGLDPAEGDLYASAIANLDVLKGFLDASAETNADWIAFTAAAGDELLTATRVLEAESTAEIRTTRNSLIVITAVAVIATLIGATMVSRSVSRLARSAKGLRDGSVAPARPSGPREVFLAGSAISEAAANFELLQRQAAALSAGELSHPDLAQVVPGEMGQSLKGVVDTLSDSIQERERAEARATWQATHDGLTGLPNRSAALELLNGRLSADSAAGVAVLFVDLDDFKDVNDSFGHPAGDEMLIAIARRLADECRSGDTICRVGGDEFVVVLGGTHEPDSALETATRVLDAVSSTVILASGAHVSVGASIGLAISGASSSVDELLKNADIATYEAKATGRGRAVLCSDELIEASRAAGQLESEVRRAIASNEFLLEYQPIVDTDGRPVSVEALIRWEHPTDGMVTPDRFIDHAERSDLIIAIDRWVIGEAARQLAEWADQLDLTIAINISGRHLNARTFVSDVLSPLRAAGVDPARLAIEITETALLDNPEQARRKLMALRAEGIRVAIDDFGTGYTAVTQLRYLPIDIIKVDRSFMGTITDQDSQDPALVRLIVNTAHLLGAQITAEGIETDEQAEVLVGMGADYMQGWLFSRSVRAEQLPATLNELAEAAGLRQNPLARATVEQA